MWRPRPDGAFRGRSKYLHVALLAAVLAATSPEDTSGAQPSRDCHARASLIARNTGSYSSCGARLGGGVPRVVRRPRFSHGDRCTRRTTMNASLGRLRNAGTVGARVTGDHPERNAPPWRICNEGIAGARCGRSGGAHAPHREGREAESLSGRLANRMFARQGYMDVLAPGAGKRLRFAAPHLHGNAAVRLVTQSQRIERHRHSRATQPRARSG